MVVEKTLKKIGSDKFLYPVIPYLSIMFILVIAGNPLIPVQSLADMGIGWHHIPEVLGFFFLGMWLGILPTLYSEKPTSEALSWRDPVSLLFIVVSVLLVGLTYQALDVIATYAVIPSAFGFLVRRGIMIKRKS